MALVRKLLERERKGSRLSRTRGKEFFRHASRKGQDWKVADQVQVIPLNSKAGDIHPCGHPRQRCIIIEHEQDLIALGFPSAHLWVDPNCTACKPVVVAH